MASRKKTLKLDKLAPIRKALGISQSQLATVLDISVRAVQSYEQGWRPVPPWVQRLCSLLLFLRRRKTKPVTRPCWKVRGCAEQKRASCPAFQLNAGDLCWLITGKYCSGTSQKDSAAKLACCSRCPVMIALQG